MIDLDEVRDRLLRAARLGCWCQRTRKPCQEHLAYSDGMDDLIEEIERMGRHG